jgi:hypothetical protein
MRKKMAVDFLAFHWQTKVHRARKDVAHPIDPHSRNVASVLRGNLCNVTSFRASYHSSDDKNMVPGFIHFEFTLSQYRPNNPPMCFVHTCGSYVIGGKRARSAQWGT